MIFLLLIAAAYIVLGLLAWLGFCRSEAGGQPVPLALAEEGLDALAAAVFCPLCSGGGAACECTTDCGHPGCTYDHTSMAVITAADMRMLQEWIRRGDG